MSKVSLGIYPPIIRIQSNPNVTVKVPITVLNNSDKNLQIEIFLKSFYDSGDKDGSISYYSEKDLPDRDSNFIKLVKVMDKDSEIKNINLYPKEYKTLNLEFKAPDDLASDYYFSVVFSKNVEKANYQETKSYLQPSVATNILLSKADSNPSAVIDEFNTEMIHLNSPVKIYLEIKNTSEQFQTISGKVIVYNTFGKVVDHIELSPEVVLANSSKVLHENKNDQEIELGSKFMLGLYKAHAEIKSEGKTLASKDVNFISVPFGFMLILIFVLIFILGITLKVLRLLNFHSKSS